MLIVFWLIVAVFLFWCLFRANDGN
jgi:hypothetical protein